MSEIATYTFLPWLREGIANQISGVSGNRATIPINLTVSGDKVDGNGQQTGLISKDIQIYGPGDITGIDGKNIVKVEPRNWITNFEPNYLPYIEFYDEDFPWRYTPLANPANGQHRLKPWLSLIILKESEFSDGKNIKDNPLPYIKLDASAELQNLAQSWAWAHVHVNRDIVKEEEDMIENDDVHLVKELEKLLNKNPDLAYSRIVCPRKLEAKEAYHAFLVPSFESGRLAGLGQDPTGTSAGEPAWTDANIGDRQMPYYHRWYFRTGTIGDFEYLVRLLEPKPVDSRVGVRDMDVQNPGANLKGIDDADLQGMLRLGGALRIPESSQKDLAEAKKFEYWAFRDDLTDAEMLNLNTQNQPLNISSVHPFQKNIAAFINLTDGYQDEDAEGVNNDPNIIQEADATEADQYDIKNNPDPVITAPLYGRWHALTQRLMEKKDGSNIPNNYNWIHELNLDPRWRTSAGFGTKVIQENQEDYMKAAWEQIGDVLEANKKIKQAQLAKIVSDIWYNNHLKPIQENKLSKWVNLASPVHNRVISQGLTVSFQGTENLVREPSAFVGTTVQFQKQESKLTSAATSVNMRKVLRPRGKFVKRVAFDENVNADNLITRINSGEVSAAPPRQTPDGIQTVNEVAEEAKKKGIPKFLIKLLENNPWIKWIALLIALILIVLIIVFSFSTAVIAVLAAVIGALIFLFTRFNRWSRQLESSDSILEENQTPESVDELPKSPDFRISTPEEDFTPTIRGNTDSEEAIRFKAALKDVYLVHQESAKVGVVPERPTLDLPQINATVFESLSPALTIPRWTYASVVIPKFILYQMKETFVEAMAYPKFNLPMYKPLVEFSSELFLPNINFIDQNSISILETNQKFIESYMVGLNHEFARELLWREYVTDQRGSYFRQFWEVNGLIDNEPLTLQSLRNRYQAVLDDRYIADLQETYDQLNADDAADLSDDFLEEAREQIHQEELKDIKPLHYWSKFSKLGEHDNRELPGDTEEELVLVIRGELLKKYPTAVIYAHRAKWQTKEENGQTVIDKTKERELVELTASEELNPPTDKIKSPLYEAKVDPDIYFFGFDLTVPEAKGGDGSDPNDDPGWFFVIKERPGEPRFGLDIGEGGNVDDDNRIELWNDLSWGDLEPAVPDGGFIQITNATPQITSDQALEDNDDEKKVQQDDDKQVAWSKDMNAAELAYILYQVPVLVAVHASEMLED